MWEEAQLAARSLEEQIMSLGGPMDNHPWKLI